MKFTLIPLSLAVHLYCLKLTFPPVLAILSNSMGAFPAELFSVLALTAFSIYWGNLFYDILVSSKRAPRLATAQQFARC